MGNLLNYSIQKADSPYWAFAIHQGHELDAALLPHMLLDDQQRLREEDPYTDLIANLPINRLKVETSRFQLDINRTVADAVYLKPEQAWGLSVWDVDFPEAALLQLRREHENIQQLMEQLIQQTINQYGYFVLFDVHSYNCKRLGPEELIDEQANPQINIGSYYNKAQWRPLIDRIRASMQNQHLAGQPIDVRENIKFKGGYVAQRLLKKFGDKGCILAIEFRKDFMDEWSGQADFMAIESCRQLLEHSLTTVDTYFTDAYGK